MEVVFYTQTTTDGQTIIYSYEEDNYLKHTQTNDVKVYFIKD